MQDALPEFDIKPDPAWATALPDWADRIINRKSMIPDLPLFDKQADKALRIFKRFRMPDVIGQPTYGEACGQWVFDFVRAIFGSYDEVAKRRMIREFFLLIPKKNGKSSIAAAIILVAAIMNVRPSAELLLIAPTMKIANIAFKQAKGIIELDQGLSDLFLVQDTRKLITHRISKAEIQIKAADADVITGGKATFTLIDETHVFSTNARAKEIFVEIRGALASRPDGFLLQITTQSKRAPAGVFKSELRKARMVRDGKIVLPILAVLYELPDAIQDNNRWKSQQYWPLVNPNLGRSVDPSFLADEIAAAEIDGAEQMALIASQHFNVQVGISQLNDGWVGAEFWDDSAGQFRTLEELMEASEVCVVGIDGGGMDDLLGLAVLGRLKETKSWHMWNKAWVHPVALEQRKDIAATLHDFSEAGDLVICDDPQQDINEIADICERLNVAGLLPKTDAIGLDPEGVAAIIDELELRKIGGAQMCAVTQGYKLTGAIKGTERKLFDGSLKHSNQPLMDWCVGNARTEARGNAIVVTKAVSGSGKIDPLMAGFNAVTLMSKNPSAGGVGSMLLGMEEVVV